MNGAVTISLPAAPATAVDLEQLARLLIEHLGSSGAALLAACLDEAIEDLGHTAASHTG